MPRPGTRLSLLVLTAIAALAAGCGGGAARPPTSSASAASSSPASVAPSASAAASDDAAITIVGFAFSPDELTVAAGTEVVWTNEEDSLHTVTSGLPDEPDGRFDSGEIDTGVSFPVTFDEPGTYAFFCARHDFMTGQVVVTP